MAPSQIIKTMSSILNQFSGNKKDVLMFLVYSGDSINETSLRAYAKFRKRTTNAVEKDLYDLYIKSIVKNYYFYSRGRESKLNPEYFFEAAVDMIHNEKNVLTSFKTYFPKRSQTAEFLWILAEMLAGVRPVTSVAGKFPDGTGPEYLFGVNKDGILDEYALKFNQEDFQRYINMCLNKNLYDDIDGNGDFLNRVENLVREFRFGLEMDKGMLLNRIYMERFLSTGELRPLPKGINADYQYLAAQAILELYGGRYESASNIFSEALKRRNRLFKDKNIFTHPIVAFYLILSYLKSNTEKSLEKIEQFCRKKPVIENPLLMPAYFAARYLGKPMDITRYSWEFETMTESRKFQIIRDFGAIMCRYYGTKIPDGIIPQYAILRYEISPYIELPSNEKQRLEQLFGGSPIIASIYKKEKWESVLDSLGTVLNKAGATSGNEDSRSVRIGYILSPDCSELEVRTQSMLKNGSWGAGKKASLQDFLNSKLPEMDETDKKVARTAVRSFWGGQIRSQEALPHLIGTDKVLYGSFAPYSTVTIREEQPYLTIVKQTKGIEVSSNFSKKNHSSKFMTTLRWDKKNCTMTVISITLTQYEILGALFSLPVLPLEAETRLKEMLNSVSAYIEIHSDLIEGGSSLETVNGDSTIHLRITPEQGNYKLQLHTKPLKNGQLTFSPGNGDRTIYDEADGQRFQVKRKLSKEKQLLEKLVDFFGDELGSDTVQDDMLLEPEGMLKLTEWMQQQAEGYAMEWPENKKIKVAPVASTSISIHSSSKENWFEVEGEISYGTEGKISLDKLLELISTGNMTGNYIRLNDETFLSVTEMLKKQIKRLGSISQSGRDGVRISMFNVGPLAELVRSGQMEVVSDNSMEDLEKKVRDAAHMEVEVPEGLNATLRDYQMDGFRWISRLDHWGAGACLADDMGLGKTLQAIAFMLRKAPCGPSLVMAPASVVMNWKKEFARFAPGMTVSVLNEETNRKEVVDSAGPSSVIISSYGLLAHNEDIVTSKEWNVVCLDEAHTIKNRMTRTSASAMQLKATSRLILTGTPVQNYLGELWNLLQFLNPGLLGSFEQFSRKFISADNRESLKRMVQPFILRRTKAEVLDELPEKTDIVRTVKLSDPEMLTYEHMRQRVENQLEGEQKVNVNVLAEITRLRQAACSVALIDKHWIGESSKLKELKLLLDEIISGGNRVLIFSQFTSFLDMVNKSLNESGYDYFYLNGSTPIAQRTKMVNAFQKNEKNIFVISLKAGGLGLNLTGANYVIHLDPWWNPAIEQQATDRAHRIGQKEKVTVYHLVSEHTIEEKILRLHDSKRKLADTFLEGTSTATSITISELRELCSGE